MRNEAEGAGPSRVLFSIPIIHTQEDMGTLSRTFKKMKISTFGREKVNRSARLVDKTWETIEKTVESLTFAPGKTRIYQDGLPVCGAETRIVSELAEAGSRNHKLLLRLQERGAVTMGTESPELLLEEYGRAVKELSRANTTRAGANTTVRNREAGAHSLLHRRDRYIAARINATLSPGETAILFLGMLHAVEPYLDPDIRVVYPLRTEN